MHGRALVGGEGVDPSLLIFALSSQLAPSGLWPSGASSARLWERLNVTGPMALSRAASPAAPRSRGQLNVGAQLRMLI